MCQIAITIPAAVLYDTRMSKEETLQFARKMVAVGYYTQNRVSLGYCAQIAGVDKESFMKILGENHISVFQYDEEEEFMEELDNA